MNRRDLIEAVGAYIDARHPRLVRAILGTRWGGLRSVELDPVGWSALLGSGATIGLSARSGARLLRQSDSRPVRRSLSGMLLAAASGAAASWFALWRWDTVRWRRRYTALVVDLPGQELDELAKNLQGVAPVETWEDPFGLGGPRRGLLVPVRDLRAVNAALGTSLGWFNYR